MLSHAAQQNDKTLAKNVCFSKMASGFFLHETANLVLQKGFPSKTKARATETKLGQSKYEKSVFLTQAA